METTIDRRHKLTEKGHISGMLYSIHEVQMHTPTRCMTASSFVDISPQILHKANDMRGLDAALNHIIKRHG